MTYRFRGRFWRGSNWAPRGYEKITWSGAGAKTLTVPVGARWCLMTNEAQRVYLRDDGVAATATTGLLLEAYPPTPWEYRGILENVSMYCAASNDLHVSYYG